MRQPKKDHAAPKQKQSAVEYIWEERGCMQQRREPIVRCRDCEYYEDYTGCCTRRDNIAPMAATPEGFCAWGERREP